MVEPIKDKCDFTLMLKGVDVSPTPLKGRCIVSTVDIHF